MHGAASHCGSEFAEPKTPPILPDDPSVRPPGELIPRYSVIVGGSDGLGQVLGPLVAVGGVLVVLLDMLQVNLVLAQEALAVVTVIGERHESLELLGEPLAAGPAIVGEAVFGSIGGRHIHELVVAAARPISWPVLMVVTSLCPWKVAAAASNFRSPG